MEDGGWRMEGGGGEGESYVRDGFFSDAHSTSNTQQHTDATTDATYRRYTHTTRLVVVQRCTHNAYTHTHTHYTSSIDAPSEHDEVPPPALLGDDHPRKGKGGRGDVPKRDQRPHPRAQVEDIRIAQP